MQQYKFYNCNLILLKSIIRLQLRIFAYKKNTRFYLIINDIWNIINKLRIEINNTLSNNKTTYYDSEYVKLRVYAKDRYPARTFVTSSLQIYNNIIPLNISYVNRI